MYIYVCITKRGYCIFIFTISPSWRDREVLTSAIKKQPPNVKQLW